MFDGSRSTSNTAYYRREGTIRNDVRPVKKQRSLSFMPDTRSGRRAVHAGRVKCHAWTFSRAEIIGRTTNFPSKAVRGNTIKHHSQHNTRRALQMLTAHSSSIFHSIRSHARQRYELRACARIFNPKPPKRAALFEFCAELFNLNFDSLPRLR